MAQEQAHAGEHGMQADQGRVAAPSLEDYDRMLAAEPGSERLHAEKISLLCGLGRHEDALGACDAAIALHPGGARLLAHKAHILHRLGRHGEAMEAIELATGAPDVPASRGTAASPHQVSPVATDKQARRLARAAMARELAGFIEYLVDKRIISDAAKVDTVEGRRSLQKYAYVAQALGMRIGYRFDFLKSGAFSTDLSVDAFDRKTAGGGTEEFRPKARASEEFVGLVSGKGAEWLQVATFAARGHGTDGARDAFVKAKYERMPYDTELIDEAFREVSGAMGRLEREGE